MKNNKNMTYLTAISILMIVVSNIYKVTHMIFSNIYLTNFIKFGEELGTTILFFICGYAIYKNLSKKENNYVEYLKNQLKRIAPHYYISLAVCLLFTSAAIYLSKDYFTNLISHFFLFHNLFYSCHHTVNSILWVISVVFQFYLLAPILKKAVDKFPILSYIFSLFISLGLKWLLYFIILPQNNLDTSYYFIYGRQLFTTLDIFILGMLISKYEHKNKLNNYWNIFFSTFILMGIVFIIFVGSNTFHFWNAQIYSMSKKGLFYFYILDIWVALFAFFTSQINFKLKRISDLSSFLAEHSYALLVWHFLILNNLVNNSSLVSNIIKSSNWVGYLFLIVMLIIISYIIDVVINQINFTKVYNVIKEDWAKIKKITVYVGIFLIFILSISYIPKIYKNIENGEEFIQHCQGACKIANHVKEKMECPKDSCKYIYLDTEDTGYLYYNHLRYYLYPFTTKYFNTYVYINYVTDEIFMDFIKKQETDFIIVRNNEKLITYGYDLDLENGKIFTINYDATDISNLFKEVK